jgi:4-amino-4-deoxy-L-arabinose transferase-like glycosyltransferase
VLLVQTLIGPVTIVLTWLLGRRLFGPRVGLVAAAAVAVAPFAWQFEVRLLAESIVTPLTVLLMLVLLERAPTPARVVAVGLLTGLIILTRPSAIYLLPAIAAALLIAGGLRRGAVLTGLALLVTALVIAPWAVRNHDVSGKWVPLSSQDGAPYGTFNDDAAHDKNNPWAWRLSNRRDAPVLKRARQLGELGLRARLKHNYTQYIKDHPSSLMKAFYWNGLTRLWDVRRPRHVLDEARFTGRSRTITGIGLAVYWVLLPLAVAGLWLARRRRALVVPLLLMALSASIVFSAEGGTRYRAPFEPLIAVLAASAAVALYERLRAQRAARQHRPEPPIAQPVG